MKNVVQQIKGKTNKAAARLVKLHGQDWHQNSKNIATGTLYASYHFNTLALKLSLRISFLNVITHMKRLKIKASKTIKFKCFEKLAFCASVFFFVAPIQPKLLDLN